MGESPFLHFSICVEDQASLAEMAYRVSHALGCFLRYSTANGKEFNELSPGTEASILGLRIILQEWPVRPPGEPRRYLLRGVSLDDEDPGASEYVDISGYIIGILSRRTKNEWYVPELDEVLTEMAKDERSTE